MNNKSNSNPSRAESLALFDHASTTEALVNLNEELLHELQTHQTERKRVDEELRIAAIAFESQEGMMVTDANTVILRVNRAFTKLTGYSEKEAVGKTPAMLKSGLQDTAFYQRLWATLKQNHYWQGEILNKRKDGIIYSEWMTISAVVAPDGDITHYIGAFTDISKIKQKEQELQKFEAIVNSTDDAIIGKTPDGIIQSWNSSAERIFGYTKTEAIGKPIQILIPADRFNEENEILLRVSRGESINHFETVRQCKDGRLINISATISPVFDITSGALVGVSKIARDISERKRSEEIIKKSRDQLLTFIQHAPTSVAMFDRKMNYLAASGRWLAEYGRGHEDLTGRNHYEVHPDVPAEWKVVHQQALDGATLENKDDMWIQDDGSKHWLRWAVLPWTDESAEIGGIIISAEDITAQKKMEMEISARRNEMEYLQKKHVAAQTAAAIAHELNQPLLAISAYSEAALMMMKAEKPNFDKIYKAIEGSERQSLRAGQSIRKLLEFLSVKEFPTETLDLNMEIQDVLNAANSEYELHFNPVLQLEDGIHFVRANRIHIQKVLLNLLHNSIDAMQEAHVPLPKITVTVRTMKDENVAQVTIQDNGPGVNKEFVHRLFEPFFTTKIKTNGIGMGLAISRSLIEENGGQLWIDQQEGPGATFHLTLPFAS